MAGMTGLNDTRETAQQGSNPPTVSPCPACKGQGYTCPEECRGTGRVVEGGTLPTLLQVATQLRELVEADMAMEPQHRALWPELMDELCVMAESADRYSSRLYQLEQERDDAQVRAGAASVGAEQWRARALLAEGAAAVNSATVVSQQQTIRELRAQIARTERRQLKSVGGGK